MMRQAEKCRNLANVFDNNFRFSNKTFLKTAISFKAVWEKCNKPQKCSPKRTKNSIFLWQIEATMLQAMALFRDFMLDTVIADAMESSSWRLEGKERFR